MPYSNQLRNVTNRANTDLSAMQFRVVELDSSDEVGPAGAGQCWGILQNHPASGEAGTVAVEGVSKAHANGAIAIGNHVRVSSNGLCIAVVSGAAHPTPLTTVGRAVTAAASGDIFSVDIERAVLSIASGAAF